MTQEGQADEFLQIAGAQVRAGRAMRGMSRRMVADRAEVSERHLAMIEKGAGNVSIRLLGRIANTLDIPVGHLLSPPASPQIGLWSELLGRLSEQEQREAYQLVAERYPQRQATGRVALIGLRGAGKTALGSRLASECGVPFVRTSALIEEIAGMPMREVHELAGQMGFRRLEIEAIEQIFDNCEPVVIEAGGSIVSNATAYEALLRGAHVIWLQASAREHMERVVEQGDLRPMGGRKDAMDDLIAILREREPLYANAHGQLDTTGRTEDDSFDALREMTKVLVAR